MRAALLVVACGICVSAPSHAERFTNPVIGLSIDKPADWQVLTAEANAENLRSVEVGTPEFQEVVRKYASVPLFAFTRYAEPYPNLNASVKVNTRPAGSFVGRSGQEILQALLPGISGAMADFELIIAPEVTTLAARPAGHMIVNYTLKATGASFPTRSEMWVIPRGNYLIVIGAGYRPDDKTGDRQAVLKIVNSIKLID